MYKETIYIIAGEFNVTPGSVSDRGGLVCNVGYTNRTVHQRLKDDDYKKSPGGKWHVLHMLDSCGVHDKEVHRELKKRNDVKHTGTRNTEEFIFLGDPGDGSVAVVIVQEIIAQLAPVVKTKPTVTTNVIDRRHLSLSSADQRMVMREVVERELARLAALPQRIEHPPTPVVTQAPVPSLDDEIARLDKLASEAPSYSSAPISTKNILASTDQMSTAWKLFWWGWATIVVVGNAIMIYVM